MAARRSSSHEALRPHPALLEVVDPIYLANSQGIRKAAEKVIRARQELNEHMGVRDLIKRKITADGPVVIHVFADLHLGHIAVDMDRINKKFEQVLNTPNAFVVLAGDPLEGMNPAYASTVVAQTGYPFQEQIETLRGYLEPLAEQGKVLGMVTGYDGHTGWAKQLTLDIYHDLARGFKIPLLSHGGIMELRINGWLVRAKCFHIPPAGTNDLNLVAGYEKDALNTDPPIDLILGGHTHKYASGGVNFADGTEVYIHQEGTDKDVSGKPPHDAFLRGRNAANRYHSSGGGLVLFGRGGKPKILAGTTLESGSVLNEAAFILNQTERQNITDEVLANIRAAHGNEPQVAFSKKHSKKMDRPEFSEAIPQEYDDTPPSPKDQFSQLSYNVLSSLPVMVMPIAHTLLGSSGAEEKQFQRSRKEIIDAVAKNPYAFLLVMRGMLDRPVADRQDRRAIVDKLAALLEPVGSAHRILAFLLDGEGFRKEAWKKPVGDYTTNPDLGPFMPGSELAETLNTHLINHLSVVSLLLQERANGPKVDYNLLAVDRSSRGTTQNTFAGLRRIHKNEAPMRHQLDAIVGGHNPRSGAIMVRNPYSQTRDTVGYAALGWNAYVNTVGKGSRQAGSKPGQALILMPGERQVYPAKDLDYALELFAMLTLYVGLGNTPELISKIMTRTDR